MEEQATETTEVETKTDPFDFSNEPAIEPQAEPEAEPQAEQTGPDPEELQKEVARLKDYAVKTDKWLGHYFPSDTAYEEFETWHKTKGQPAQETPVASQDDEDYDVFKDLEQAKAELAEVKTQVHSLTQHHTTRQQSEAMSAVDSEANRLAQNHPWMQDKSFRDQAFMLYSAYNGRKTLEQVVKGLTELKHAPSQATKQMPPTPIHSSAPGRSSGPPTEDPEDLYSGPEMFENIKRITKNQFGIS